MFGTTNAYIGVRRRGTVQAGSIGGASTDSMTSEVTINGAGDGIVGFITIDETIPEKPVFTWTATTLDAPIITSPIMGTSVTGTDVTIEGTGKAGSYVFVIYGSGSGDRSSAALVSPSGDWSVPIPAINLGRNARIAAIQYTNSTGTGQQSVSSTPVSFTTDAATLDAPVITSPANNETGVAITTTIEGTGRVGATVTVQSGLGTMALNLLFGNGLPPFKVAFDGLKWFLNCGLEMSENSKENSEQYFSFEDDKERLFSAFMVKYGINLNKADDLHWFEFIALMNDLNKTAFRNIVDLRMLTPKDMKNYSKEQKQEIARQKRKFAIKKSLEQVYTDEQIQAIDKFDRLIGIKKD